MTAWFQRRPRWFLALTALALVLAVGAVDYRTGYEVSLSVLYLLGIAIGVWFVGEWYGALLSLLSVTTSLFGDLAAGERFANRIVPVWNGVILMAFYLVVVRSLSTLRHLQTQLEERVRLRTAALSAEIAERMRLEKEILAISEREQQRIGHDLHDSLSQHLTGTALAGEVLAEKLAAKGAAESADAHRVVALVEEGIALARSLTRELSPMNLESAGLMDTLQELAANVAERFRVACRFECDAPVSIRDPATAIHLYRIAQEAISNAIRHGHAMDITIQLAKIEAGTVLEVCDDGVGLPDPLPEGHGMGLRIMAYRAAMIHGTLAVRRGAAGGTEVTCILP